jgi:thiol-disulfide isomerase/thioredoxin
VKKFLFYAICSIIVVISACSNNNNDTGDSNGSSSSKGKTVNEIELINLKEYEGIKNENIGKVVIANFYASWCPPCRQEIPGFINSYNKFKKDLEIIGLSLDPDDNAALKFVNEMGINYKVYRADESLQRRFNIMTIPVSVIYKADGSLYNIHFGYLSEGEIERLVKTLN